MTEPRLPVRLKFLLVSAHIESIIAAAFIIVSILVSTFVGRPQYTPIINTFIISAPFLTYSVLLIQLLKRYYPSREIGVFFRIVFISCIVLIGFFQLYCLVGLIWLLIEGNPEQQPQKYPVLFDTVVAAACIALVLQLYNSIEGVRLLNVIRKKHRTELLESF